MNTKLDFNKYDDYLEVINFDLFIDSDGCFYKVRKKRNKHVETHHEDWAIEYIQNNKKIQNFLIKMELENKINLEKLKNPIDILINIFGFVYYTHDDKFYQPVIQTPNPIFNGQVLTEEQKDSLFNIMLVNNENPYDVPMLMGEQKIYEYVKWLS